MLKYFFILLCPFIFSPAWSQWDYKFATRARTFPSSLLIDSELGFNQLLWKNPISPYTYGFLRPTLNYSEIGIYRVGQLALEFYPISFFKWRAGFMQEDGHVKRKELDCSSFTCQGKIQHRFLQTQLTLGAKDFFFQGKLTYAEAQKKEGEYPFLNFENMIALAPQKDHWQQWQWVLGKKITELYALAILEQRASSQSQGVHSAGHYALLLRSGQGPIDVFFGAGLFHSDLTKNSFSALFQLNYSGGQSLVIRK